MSRHITISQPTDDGIIVVGTLSSWVRSGFYIGDITVAVPDQLQRQVEVIIAREGGSWDITLDGKLFGNAYTLTTAAKAAGEELAARARSCSGCWSVKGEPCDPFCIGKAAAQDCEVDNCFAAATPHGCGSSHCSDHPHDELDTSSSASRQHYIDTGSYLPKLPKVEVVVHRDVDGPTQTTVFLDGIDVTAQVTVVDIDPGYGGTPQEWHESHQETAKKLSPDAAELVTEIVQGYSVDESWD